MRCNKKCIAFFIVENVKKLTPIPCKQFCLYRQGTKHANKL
jgi:hypothetical protein